MPQRPNILIICTDEQRGDHLGCMGHPHLKTPHIDRIAAEGTLFRNCYTSCPICMPARATMITGLTNRGTGVVDNGISLNPDLPTLPGLLADAGYRTHAVGKLHLRNWGKVAPDDDDEARRNPERRMYWDWPDHWQGTRYQAFPDRYYGFQTVELANGHVNYVYGDYVTWLEKNHPGVYGPGYRCSNVDPHPLAIDPDLHYNAWIADRTIDFVRKHVADRGSHGHRVSDPSSPARRQEPAGGNPAPDPDTPFFLWCSFPDPHEPFAAVRTWSDFYDHIEIELPRNTLELSPLSRSETMTRAGIGTSLIDPALVKKAIRQTYGMISHVDEHVGRILNALEDLGISERTVVLFVSDHGDQLGEHGLFYKSVYPYDAHMHVPFVARIPGGAKGRVVDDVVSLLDLVPTALDLAGVPHPWDQTCDDGRILPALPGEALTPVLKGEGKPARKNALVEISRLKPGQEPLQMQTLVTNEFKLVFYPVLQEVMLFDRRNDPLEWTNLAHDPKHQAVAAEMLKQLLSEVMRTEKPVQCMRRLGK